MAQRDEEALIMMGRVLESHHVRFKARQKARATHLAVDNLPKAFLTDWPEGGGTGWKSAELSELEAVANYSRYQKTNAESRFKFLKLTFLEHYPEKAVELTEALRFQSNQHAEASQTKEPEVTTPKR